jgi:hypothetical protein
MAITAHWISNQANTVSLQSELIAFHCVPDRHTGEHLAEVFLNIFDRYQIQKVCYHLYITVIIADIFIRLGG